jgi:tRNA(Ile)-lysidine synthase
MDNLLVRFGNFVKAEQLFRPGHRLLVTVSGGVDSVVLARLCRSAGYYIEIAHCNFQLRGEESLRDEEYTAQFAGIINAPFHVRRFDTAQYAASQKLSVQEAARELRYSWFRELAEQRGMDRILTAHHADDNVETMLMNLFKGTGIAGLRGILPLSGNIARPLLFASRIDIEHYAAEHGIGYVEDSSNTTDKYSRNYFRINIIPMVEKVFPGAVENMRDNLLRFREVEMLYREGVNKKITDLIVEKGVEKHIPVEKLRMMHPLKTILFELLSPYGYSVPQLDDIIRLMDAETGKYICSATHRLLKNRNWFILASKRDTEMDSVHVVERDTEKIVAQNGTYFFSNLKKDKDFFPDPDPFIAQLDAAELSFPLTIRTWKEGDYFYPLGMRKKKKIARFLIDKKLSRTEKEKAMVVLSGDRIIWLAGMRIDERVKVKSATGMIFVMKFHF